MLVPKKHRGPNANPNGPNATPNVTSLNIVCPGQFGVGIELVMSISCYLFSFSSGSVLSLYATFFLRRVANVNTVSGGIKG